MKVDPVGFATWRSALAATVLLGSLFGWGDSSFASGHGAAGHEAPAHGHGGHGGELESTSTSSGVDLGEYRIRSYYPVIAQKSIVRFVLFATAPPDRLEEAKQLVAQRSNRVRDQVITATRMVPLADFDDPELTRFRRRLILRLRRTIPELPLDDVYISNFELQVQSL